MLPPSLLITGRTWRIYCSQRPPSWVKRERGEKLEGYCDPVERRIWVRKHPDPEERRSSLAHEVLHAIAPYISERDVLEAEEAFYSLLRDNDLTSFRERR